MSIHLVASGVRAVLLDIEGTTTPISFVHEVLFPYARARLAEYLADQRDSRDVGEVLRRLAEEHADSCARGEQPPPPPQPHHATAWLDSAVAYAGWLMDRDRKSPGLKLLQGLIWERGYQAGELRGDVFADVPEALRRWRQAGLRIAIYSSGSELAQRRLFESTGHGNLLPLLSGFFDTAVGAKTSADSYRKIAAALDLDPAAILFVSDVTAELDAARAAGLRVALSVRPGNAPQPPNTYDVVGRFDDLVV
jgi:2,3-diketo-5-methylthio-1-phosphopentane phosphatase